MMLLRTPPDPAMTKAQVRSRHLVTWAFAMRADDGNRTRVFSLGTRVIMLERGPDLRSSMCVGRPC
jgi:hypothetical protein